MPKAKRQRLKLCSCKGHYLFHPCPKRRVYPESFLSQMVNERYGDLFVSGDSHLISLKNNYQKSNPDP